MDVIKEITRQIEKIELDKVRKWRCVLEYQSRSGKKSLMWHEDIECDSNDLSSIFHAQVSFYGVRAGIFSINNEYGDVFVGKMFSWN